MAAITNKRVKRSSWFIIIHWIHFIGVTQCQDGQCPTLGTNQSYALNQYSTNEGLFFNFNSPSQCTGKVTGWRFCLYSSLPTSQSLSLFRATFVIYRRQQLSSSIYSIVPRSAFVTTITNAALQQPFSQFSCLEAMLESENQFNIQENDIVAACIQIQRNLYLMGRDSRDGNEVLQDETAQSCSLSAITSVDIDRTDERERTMHLSAIVDSTDEDTCRAGDNPPPSMPASSNSLRGIYVSNQAPVSCGTHITKWHYCYYPQSSRRSSEQSMTVSVWSLGADNRYRVNPTSIRTITVPPVETEAKIFCMQEHLNTTEYVSVSLGDMIGVSLPENNPISVLRTNENMTQSILWAPNFDNTSLNLMSINGISLHVYATIEYLGKGPSPTSDQVPTSTDLILNEASTISKSEPSAIPSSSPINLSPTIEAPNTNSLDFISAYEAKKPNYFLIYTITAPVGGGLLTMILIGLIVCCIIICKREKRKRMTMLNRQTENIYDDILGNNEKEFDHVYMSPNVAYNSKVSRSKQFSSNSNAFGELNKGICDTAIYENIPLEDYEYISRYEL